MKELQLPYSTNFFENAPVLVEQYRYALSNLLQGNFSDVDAMHLGGALICAKNAGKFVINMVKGLSEIKPRQDSEGEGAGDYQEA